MAQFIRVGNRFLNLDQVIDAQITNGTGGVVVTLSTTELVPEGDEQVGFGVSRTMGFIGEEGAALAAFFIGMAPDVMAMHRAQQETKALMVAQAGPRCASCRAVPVPAEGQWCVDCLLPEEAYAADMADFEARR